MKIVESLEMLKNRYQDMAVIHDLTKLQLIKKKGLATNKTGLSENMQTKWYASRCKDFVT